MKICLRENFRGRQAQKETKEKEGLVTRKVESGKKLAGR